MDDELTMNKIVKEDGKWYVRSEKGKNLGGPYDTKEAAEERLKEVEMFKHMKKNQLVTMKTNVTPVVRNDRMQDKDWIVVPMVMLVEGVHNGSCGALYYPKEELEKTPVSWNAKPVVVYHPDGPTACDPDVMTNRAIGMIMNTKFEDGKLKAEAWLDPVRMEKVDKRVAEAIEKKVVMELSTGLFTDIEGPEGEWGKEKYDAVAKNYRPDHLALLPDMTGACSVSDGAGFLRLNSEKKEIGISDSWAKSFFPYLQAAGINTDKLAANEISHNDIWRQLQKEIEQKQPKTDDGLPNDWYYVTEVFPDYFVYEAKDKLFKQAYSVKDDKVSLNGIPEEVVRVVTYKVVNEKNVNDNQKGKTMDKSQLIAKLIGNKESGWTESDKETLESMTEKQLEALIGKIPQKNAEPVKKEEQKPAVNAEPVKPVVNVESQKVEDKKPITTEEFIASAPKDIQNVLSQGIKAYNAEKEKLIATIFANPQNAFTKEALATKDVDELRLLAKLAAAPAKPDAPNVFDYSGQANTVSTANAEVEVLELPAMNFEKK